MTNASREELRAELLAKIPRWYWPAGHLAFPTVAGLAVAAFALSRIVDPRPWQLAFVPVFFLLGNAIEWTAHRGLLHRRTRPLRVLYLRHVPEHHALFVAEDMAIRSLRELRFVLLPGYGLLSVLAASVPLVLAFSWIGQPNLAALWVACAATYFLAYEWLHLAYHLPETSPVARLPVVQRRRRHHQIHHAPHLMQRWNFNVTFPLWDILRGTSLSPAQHRPGAPAAARRTP
jgi:hypothetical protein